MRAFFINSKLDIRKIDNMQLDRSCIGRYQACKVNYLFFRSLTRIRWCMEISCLDLNASLGNHIAGNRTVDSS